MGLPKLDIPVNLLTWEVSLPDRIEVNSSVETQWRRKSFRHRAERSDRRQLRRKSSKQYVVRERLGSLKPGQVGGIIVDPIGAVVPGGEVTATNTQTGARSRRGLTETATG